MAKPDEKKDVDLKRGPKPKLVKSEALYDQLRALGRIQCTYDEASSVLRCSKRTLQMFFDAHPDARETFDSGKLEGLASLRRKQFSMAETNATMAIWLGKQYLGQRDKTETEVNINALSDLLDAVDGQTRGIPTLPSDEHDDTRH
jgi:hypothetical protein